MRRLWVTSQVSLTEQFSSIDVLTQNVWLVVACCFIYVYSTQFIEEADSPQSTYLISLPLIAQFWPILRVPWQRPPLLGRVRPVKKSQSMRSLRKEPIAVCHESICSHAFATRFSHTRTWSNGFVCASEAPKFPAGGFPGSMMASFCGP